jgi:hypothetical protein
LAERDWTRWEHALAALADPDRQRVELEMSQVCDMANLGDFTRLIEAVPADRLPADSIPGEAPLALWFLLHSPDLFQDAYLQSTCEKEEVWRAAQAPTGIALSNPARRKTALATSIKNFFSLFSRDGPVCKVSAYQLNGFACFVAKLSDRLRLFQVFTEKGKQAVWLLRPSIQVVFLYDPLHGRILIKASRRAAVKVLDLFRRFACAVLQVELPGQDQKPVFSLNLFKRPFAPAPDARDMEMVRVKALHLVYPKGMKRRMVKLETMPDDDQFAIMELLKQHGGGEDLLKELDVLYVELQVKMRLEKGKRSYLIRLWPDRCSLNPTALGARLQNCLRRWGIDHERQP